MRSRRKPPIEASGGCRSVCQLIAEDANVSRDLLDGNWAWVLEELFSRRVESGYDDIQGNA